MKHPEINIYNYSGQQSKTVYDSLSEAIIEYDRLYHENKKNPSFYEWCDGKGFTIDGLTVSLQWWNEPEPAPIANSDARPLIYLASPYTGNEEENFQKVSKKAAELMNEGFTIFSPIAMCHPMSVHGKLPGGWEFWEKFDRAYLSVCNKIIVYQLPGWDKSKGVTAEIKIAQELGIPVEYIN